MTDLTDTPEDGTIGFTELGPSFQGAVPIVIATVSADGIPNVTYLSKAQVVDDQRLALSNQFLSKSARNLAEHPRASLLILDPETFDEFRLEITYERTERRGAVFDRLRGDVDAIAAMSGMEDVFRLRAADIYRLDHAEVVPSGERADGSAGAPPWPRSAPGGRAGPALGAVAALCSRLDRCTDLDTLVRVAVDGLAQLLGYEHSMLMLLDETGERLFTIASHGYDAEGVGSEILVGEGVAGVAARIVAPVRVGNARQMGKYSRSVRASFESAGELATEHAVPLPDLSHADSGIAVPLRSLGVLVGVLAIESPEPARYAAEDEAALSVIASVLGSAIESIRVGEREAPAPLPAALPAASPAQDPAQTPLHVRFFGSDGSTFLDGDYLIKGVAGRLLWSLLRQHSTEGRVDFTNREVRLDPSLDLPDFRDNFESRLILLKRRLDEREAPIRIEKTGRGRFRLVVQRSVALDEADTRS